MYERRLVISFSVLLMLGISGCANFNSVYREFDVTKRNSVAIDAKQRVVITAPTVVFPKDGTQPAGYFGTNVAVCAEPSPDALSAFANSASANLQGSGSEATKIALQGALSASESAAFVGLRTQTIQLLRDGMYRLCEGYLSGALDPQSFATMQRRYQNLMMGLLAIEQLTGAVTPKPVTLNVSGSASTGGETQQQQDDVTAKQKVLASDNEALAKSEGDIKDQTNVVKNAQTTLEEKKNTLTDLSKKTNPSASSDELAAAKTDVQNASDALKTEQSKLDGLQKDRATRIANVKADQDALRMSNDALVAAKGRVNAATSGSSSYFGAESAKLDPATSAKIAETVELIVKDVISTSFMQDTCLSFLTSSQSTPSNFRGDSSKYEALRDACYSLLATQVDKAAKTASSPVK